jgi:plasmid stabilization system protein ParE
MTSTFFNAQSMQELRDRIGYEDWLLESVYKLAEDELFPDWPDAVVYELGALAPVATVYGRANILLGDWRPGFLDAGAPLVFTATFKLLDMLFEWILEKNGVRADFRFAQKLLQLQAPGLQYPSILKSRQWLVEGLKALYSEAEPLRGTIIHSRHFESTNGSLRVASSKRGDVGQVVALDANDLRGFAQLCVSMLRFLQQDWTLSEHRDKVLRWQLDGLVKLHKLTPLGQREPRHTRVRWYTIDPRIQNVDVGRIRRDIEAQNPGQDMSFDLRVVVLSGKQPITAYLVPHEDLSQLSAINDASRFRCDLPE